jgi:hypothetical protein
MTSSVTAVIALAIAGVLMWKKKFPKLVAFLTLVAGASITGGLISGWMQATVDWISRIVGAVTSQAFGVAVPAVMTVIMVLVYVLDMWPKHTPTRITAIIGLFLPLVAVAMPGEAGSAISQFITMLGQAGGTFVTAIVGTGA